MTFQHETYEKMTKNEAKKLEADYRNNEKVQTLVQQNMGMKKQIAEEIICNL